jgi:hypothetical protein
MVVSPSIRKLIVDEWRSPSLSQVSRTTHRWPCRLAVLIKQSLSYPTSETYRSGVVVANVLPSVHDRAAPLFADVGELVHCDSLIHDPA